MKRIGIALVGVGKIARDQHIPAIAANPAFELVAAASPHHQLDGVANFTDVESLLASMPDLDAVAVCTPPQVRHHIAACALERGRHVILEKPPGATLGEVEALVKLADRQGVSLFASWHSREAAGVEPARRWLEGRGVLNATVTWKEDVRVWHPGQSWIWLSGGLGVFDPAINALSIITRILTGPLLIREAEMDFPANCDAPIAARLVMSNGGSTFVRMDLDFLQTGPQTWNIDIETTDGRLLLSKGGAVLSIDGNTIVAGQDREYPNLYARFEQLIRQRRIDVDVSPFRLVADAFLCGRRVTVEPFVE